MPYQLKVWWNENVLTNHMVGTVCLLDFGTLCTFEHGILLGMKQCSVVALVQSS